MTRKDDDDIGAQVSSRLEELFGEDDETDEQEAPRAESIGRQETEKTEQVVAEEETGQQPIASRKEQDAGFDTANSPLNELKALVFGIDWEINEESMAAFLKEIRQLQQRYGKDKIFSTFLKLHESVGKYIKAKKSRAHPDALKFVTSVFTSFEKALMTPDMPQDQKKRLLAEEIRKFKDFKEKVASKKKPVAPQSAAAARAEDKPAAAVEEHPSMAVEQTTVAQTLESPAEGPEEKPAAAATGEKPAAVLDNQEAIDYIVAELKKTIQEEFRTMHQILKSLGA